jgi:hypothetical protein
VRCKLLSMSSSLCLVSFVHYNSVAVAMLTKEGEENGKGSNLRVQLGCREARKKIICAIRSIPVRIHSEN